MSAPTTEYPSLAEIVREETGGGRLIVQFYLGVADGSLEGFRDNHRMSAARRLDKIAPGLVREYLTRHHNEHVRESMRHTLFPMGTIAPLKKDQPERRGPNLFQRRLTRLVRQETGDGRSIVNFLIAVMDGALPGFKPHHRLESAAQLASYITSPTVIPAEAGIQRGGEESTPSPSTGEGWGEGDSPQESRIVRPELGSPELSRRVEEPSPSTLTPSPSTGEGWGEGDSPQESRIVRPELGSPELSRRVEEPSPSTLTPSPSTGEGWGEGDSPQAEGDRPDGEADSAVIPADSQSDESPNPENPDSDNPRSRPRTRMPRKLRRQMGDARARKRREQSTHDQDNPRDPELTPAERRIRKKLEQHWHGPDPLDGEPFFHNYVPP